MREFIDAQFTDDATDTCDAGIAGATRNGFAAFFRIYDHTTELENFKNLAVFGAALLLIEHRAAILELDGQGCKKKQRGKQNKCRKGKQNIDHALDKVVPETLASVLIFHHGRIDQMTRSEAFHGDLTELRRDIEAFAALHAVPDHL